ncbi:MAG: sodium/solute symporter [Planctomycetes bacterium]|nr:sodium/solute symporter [Planctomycetota bacterium]
MPVEKTLNISHPEFGTVNTLVIVLYMLAMLAVGWWCSRRMVGLRSFFIGEGKVNHIAVGLSLLGTYLSSLTMMALSGLAFGPSDLTWTVQLPFLILTAFVITRHVLPRYREAGVISVYEFLEQRIHVSSRLLAAACFCAFSIARMGIVLYLPALAFHIVTGFDLAGTIIVMGLVVTVYTVMGGIEAVIWTDVVQVGFIAVAPVFTLYYIFAGTGWSNFWVLAQEQQKLRTFDWGLDPRKAVTVWLVLQTVFETVRIYGTSQDMTQRYAAADSTAKANRAVWIGVLGYIPLAYAFYFIGAAFAVYYRVNPDPNIEALVAAKKTDAIYPYFIVTHLPVGIAGLIFAAIFAAAMSSIDSLLNSTSTVVIEDFYKRFSRTERSDAHYLRVAQALVVVFGLFTIAAGLSFMGEKSQMQVVFNTWMGILTNGVLGLMALAFLPFRVNRWAALAGFAASYGCLFYLMYGNQELLGLAKDQRVSFLLRPVICNPVCFLVALGVHGLLKGGHGNVETQ